MRSRVGKTRRFDDFDRPLNNRGQNDAPWMGRVIAANQLLPEKVLCSPALRARTTAEAALEAAGFPGEIEFRPELYLAAPQNYIEALKEVGDSANRVMIVGHNPGLEELLTKLVGHFEHLPTAALAEVELPIDDWKDLSLETPGKLRHLWRPK